MRPFMNLGRRDKTTVPSKSISLRKLLFRCRRIERTWKWPSLVKRSELKHRLKENRLKTVHECFVLDHQNPTPKNGD